MSVTSLPMPAGLRRFGGVLRHGLGAPLVVLALLAMVVVPLPPVLLDALFSFNIAISLVVLLAVVSVKRPLDFAIFPIVLLMTTMLRLALNVASVRVILLNGQNGHQAAGNVIAAFGEFVVGGNYAVGLVAFTILTIINFVVITKGAGRVSEVTARFILDAMPGKQMAIDADLNAGLLTREEARARREEVREEADFYGAMDGASKFIRGDAIAGILILFVTLIGGLIVGVMQHGMAVSEAAQTYTLLSIGDGLVSQLPALLVSSAVALLVTRASRSQDMGRAVLGQAFGQTRALAIASAILAVVGMVPGMPHVAFLTLAGLLGAAAWKLWRQPLDADVAPGELAAAVALPGAGVPELGWDDIAPVDALELEVGYRLIALVDSSQGGELMARIKGIRRKLTQDIGFLIPPVHIRDNLELKPGDYRILLSGVVVGQGSANPDQWLAIDPGNVSAPLSGAATTDPAFGLPAVWIDGADCERAQAAGYTVVDAATVVVTHLNHLLHQHAAHLLGRQEVQQLLDRIGRDAPGLTEDLVPKTVSLTVVHKVLQGLLAESVPIRDMRAILDTLAEHAPRLAAAASATPGVSGAAADIAELIALARCTLGRAITQQWFGNERELRVIGLDAKLERVLTQALSASGALEPGLADTLLSQARNALAQQDAQDGAPVLLVSPPLRALLARFLRHHLSQIAVLSNAEIPDDRIVRVTALMGPQVDPQVD